MARRKKIAPKPPVVTRLPHRGPNHTCNWDSMLCFLSGVDDTDLFTLMEVVQQQLKRRLGVDTKYV